jgi:hypothetical protein
MKVFARAGRAASRLSALSAEKQKFSSNPSRNGTPGCLWPRTVPVCKALRQSIVVIGALQEGATSHKTQSKEVLIVFGGFIRQISDLICFQNDDVRWSCSRSGSVQMCRQVGNGLLIVRFIWVWLFVAFFFVVPRAVIAAATPLSDLDSLRYIASHGDLIQAFGADVSKGRSHYEQYGVKEGRTITFDPNRYMASHPDLIMAFSGSEEKATRHYIEWGYREGRSTTTFDGLAYVASYADLIAAFGTDSVKATRHYIDWGFNEGRRVIFNSLAYIASYSDLIAAFATDVVAGAKHYIEWGYKEGRQVVFNAALYLANHADVRAVFGSDESAATKHYIIYGAKENRTKDGGIYDNATNWDDAVTWQ